MIDVLLVHTHDMFVIIVARNFIPNLHLGAVLRLLSLAWFCGLRSFFYLITRDLNIFLSDLSNKLLSLIQISQGTGYSATIVIRDSLVISPSYHLILKINRELL